MYEYKGLDSLGNVVVVEIPASEVYSVKAVETWQDGSIIYSWELTEQGKKIFEENNLLMTDFIDYKDYL